MMNQSKKQLYVITILSMAVLVIIVTSWVLTSKTGLQSNSESLKISEYIKSFIANHFDINDKDIFWDKTLNLIVRKTAHFLEYMLLGITLCTLLNIVYIKCVRSMLISFIVCTMLSLIDEFRQNFVIGRTARWFDVQLDIAGAVLGILFITAIFSSRREIKINTKIEQLEKCNKCSDIIR